MVDKSIYIDVAVLCKEYNELEQRCDDHIVNLDDIRITRCLFQELFYPHGEQFGLNRAKVSLSSNASYISLLPFHRSVKSKPFYLLEWILGNIESDLNISRDCFSRESLIDVTKELSNISSLIDMNCCSLVTSLSWSNICEMVEIYKLDGIKNIECDIDELTPVFTISIVFKTPTLGVRNTVIKFNYRIVDFHNTD